MNIKMISLFLPEVSINKSFGTAKDREKPAIDKSFSTAKGREKSTIDKSFSTAKGREKPRNRQIL